ncbi:hypothetical protein GCM10018793_04160 [Streptomyces sulfonofaciens]|uniref:Uncharacterized protein n=1 Tax=Streptomyces sulfonofaciens TaxID=68272 RepID=A0A919KSD7_9ACTN|nr:hypothetical protein [Streptomyces sulfonofaciens]GHH70316.1 hypothetical protein GCM10018793_04160 [Streptomyces sulfonofaciens]
MRRLATGRRHGDKAPSHAPRTPPAVRGALCLTAALCAVAQLPGAAVADAGAADPYAYDGAAGTVQGAASKGAAQEMALGATYKSTIGPQGGSQGKLYYRLELGARDDVYVSVTAVPRLGTKAEYADGLKVSLQDAEGYECSDDNAQFGSAESPWPVAALATRRIDPTTTACQKPGTYYLIVERNEAAASAPDDWGLELSSVTEPAARATGPSTPPHGWRSLPPGTPSGGHGRRHGGTSFSTATTVEEGVWQDTVEPGETRFYRVPVGWGQQVSAAADLVGPAGSAGPDGGTGGQDRGDFVGAALAMWLYNPVRGRVATADASYSGDRTSAAFGSLPPVAYRNRGSVDPRVSGMRFAGWYYLVVNLNPQLAEEYGDQAYAVTLQVRVSGTAERGPDYAGVPKPEGVFDVPGQDGTGAGGGASAGPAGGTLRVLGVAALGVGVALLLVLAVWTVAARRQAAAGGPPSAGRETTPTGGAPGDGGDLTGDGGHRGGATGYGDGTDPTGGQGYGEVPGYRDRGGYGGGHGTSEYGEHGQHGVDHGRAEYGPPGYGPAGGRGAGAPHGGASGHGAPQGQSGPYGPPRGW